MLPDYYQAGPFGSQYHIRAEGTIRTRTFRNPSRLGRVITLSPPGPDRPRSLRNESKRQLLQEADIRWGGIEEPHEFRWTPGAGERGETIIAESKPLTGRDWVRGVTPVNMVIVL